MRIRWNTLVSVVIVAVGSALLPGRASAVDGVVLITQASALAGNVTPGDAPGFPVTLSRSGSYRLASNLTVSSNVNGIEITADGVTLDLNGHTIAGDGSGSGAGIASSPSIRGATVTNGTVRDMGGQGILLSTGSRLDAITATMNGAEGILTGVGSVLTGCQTLANGSHGIRFGASSVLTGNVALGNGGAGMREVISSTPPSVRGGGSLVRDNTASRNTGLGLNLGLLTGYVNNVLQNNAGSNDGAQVSGGVELGTNVCGVDTLCP